MQHQRYILWQPFYRLVNSIATSLFLPTISRRTRRSCCSQLASSCRWSTRYTSRHHSFYNHHQSIITYDTTQVISWAMRNLPAAQRTHAPITCMARLTELLRRGLRTRQGPGWRTTSSACPCTSDASMKRWVPAGFFTESLTIPLARPWIPLAATCSNLVLQVKQEAACWCMHVSCG